MYIAILLLLILLVATTASLPDNFQHHRTSLPLLPFASTTNHLLATSAPPYIAAVIARHYS